MRFRANALIDPYIDAPTGGKRFAQGLLEQKLVWSDLQIQITGVKSAILTSAFWRGFKKELDDNAPEILPDIKNIEWICDHQFQEENIKQWLT